MYKFHEDHFTPIFCKQQFEQHRIVTIMQVVEVIHKAGQQDIIQMLQLLLPEDRRNYVGIPINEAMQGLAIHL